MKSSSVRPSRVAFSGRGCAISQASASMLTDEVKGRPLVEVQALVAESHLGNPRRIAVGLEQNRLAMLLAVTHRHAGIAMYDQDVYVNVVGGVRITETAADLPVLLAVLSSLAQAATAVLGSLMATITMEERWAGSSAIRRVRPTARQPSTRRSGSRRG